MPRLVVVAIFLALALPNISSAGLPGKAVREAAEYLIRKGGKEASELGLDTVTRKIETLVLKYGDDALLAVRKAGPRTFRVVEEAGENGLATVKLLARHGEDAIWVVAKKNRLAIFVKYGDDAAEAMMKHGEIAEPLINSLGKPASSALKAISAQNGRRLAMMADDNLLVKIGKSEELLAVVTRHGDVAMDFIWKNKGALTVTAALTAFLANPQPFIDGTVDISRTAVDSVAKPIASEIATNVYWTFVLPFLGLIGGAIFTLSVWLRHRATVALAWKSRNSIS